MDLAEPSSKTTLPELMDQAAALRDIGHKHITFSPKVATNGQLIRSSALLLAFNLKFQLYGSHTWQSVQSRRT